MDPSPVLADGHEDARSESSGGSGGSIGLTFESNIKNWAEQTSEGSKRPLSSPTSPLMFGNMQFLSERSVSGADSWPSRPLFQPVSGLRRSIFLRDMRTEEARRATAGRLCATAWITSLASWCGSPVKACQDMFGPEKCLKRLETERGLNIMGT